MKFLQVILTLSLMFIVPLLVAESSASSSSDNNLVTNITRGSSLSLTDTSPYWLSPSGNLAFGFYQLPCTRSSPNCPDRYVVGIWFVKSPYKTLVWTANTNDFPLHKPSSLFFTKDGKLMLQKTPDNKEKPLLLNIQEPLSYARMHDDGNFVLYGANSQIVWQSFDYPTDTILGGQKLKAEIDLTSGNYRLSVTDGLVAIYYMEDITDSLHAGTRSNEISEVVSDELEGLVSTPVTLKLGTTGDLYLVGSDGVVLKYLYQNKYQQRKQLGGGIVEEGVHIYRATLDSRGNFNLYKERIGGNISTDHNEKSSSIQVLVWQPSDQYQDLRVFVFILTIITGVVYCLAPCLVAMVRFRD